jgi:hypothetical protein
MKYKFMFFGICIFIVIIVFGVATFIFQRNGVLGEATRHIAFGVWTEGFFDPSTRQIHPETLLSFEQLINKKASIAHYYLGWEYLADPELLKQFALLRSHGWEPMLNVNPYYFSGCPATQLPLYKAIAMGKCDEFLHKAGKNLARVDEPFYLLFAWEMNNPHNEWSISHTGSSEEDFKRAWRHIHKIFQQEKATKVVWVFCPNVPDDPDFPYSKIYPGKNFVDWVGLDGYNWGTTQSWSEWINFSGVFTGSYNKMVAIAPGKPMMIAEVNTTDQGGDKGEWYRDMLTQQIPYNFPNIKAVVIFNEDRSVQENVNWKVDVTPEALEAFTSAINSKFY